MNQDTNTNNNDSGAPQPSSPDITANGTSDSASTQVTADGTQGVSNPPNDPIVADNADNSGQAQPQQPSQPVQGQSTPNNQNPSGQQSGSTNPPANPNANHPAVQRADLLHTIAQTLAGGPRWKMSVDPNTGTMTRTKVPLSRGDIGMAIAMEAIGGALSGLSVKPGPGNLGRAAGAGFAQEQAERQQSDKENTDQANSDFANHAQVMDTNMRLFNNAMTAGRQSFESNVAYVAQYKDLADKLQTNYPEAVKGVIPESDFAKYHVTKDTAIPYSVVKRLDPKTGEQVVDSHGSPQWDIDYMVVDPSFKSDDLLTPEDKATAVKYGIQGYVNGKGEANNLPESIPMKLGMVNGLKSKLTALQLGENDLGNYYDTLNHHAAGNNTPVWKMFPDTNGLADFITQHESGGKPDARSVRNNNPGNLKAVNSSQKQDKDGFRIFDNEDQGKQALIGQLSRDMQRMPNATPEQYFAHYSPNTDPGNGPGTSEGYAAAARQAAGISPLNPDATDPNAQQYQPVDLVKAVHDDPTLPAALEKFSGMFNQTGNIGQAISELAKKDPQAAGKITALYGGRTAVDTYDQMRSSQKVLSDETARNTAKLDYDQGKKTQEEQGIISRNENLINAIASGKNIDLSRIATMRAYDREIIVNEILRKNPAYNPASIDRAIKLADQAADEDKAGTIGNSIKNVNTAFGHMGEATELLQKLKSEHREFSDYTNKPVSYFDEHFGTNPDYIRYKTALHAAATDWQNLLNNQHALTDYDKQIADSVADPNAQFGNAVAAISEMARTGAVRTIPLNEEWKQTMHTNFPNLIQPATIEALKKINDPTVNDMLKDLESGGDLVNGQSGVGSPGKRVGDLLGLKNNSQPSQQAAVPGMRQGETPVYSAGKVVGFTMPGKQGMRPATGQ